MIRKVLVVVFSILGFICSAQSVMNENLHQSLNVKYSAKVLLAYQESSKTKIEDLFTYFQMLTDASLTDDLKKEVVANINQLFRNKDAMVVDFTTESLDKIPLQLFIQKLLISEPINFAVSEETKFNSVTFESWKTDYAIIRTKSGLTTKTKVIQVVYMNEEVKVFGKTAKNVIGILLDEMQ